MPDLAGSADEAAQALDDARLVGAPSEAFSADVAAGDVMSQDPAAGTSVPVGATVAYVVSLGVETIAVPDLAGSADEAAQALEAARLVGAPSEAFSADVAAGDVVSQDPAAGTSVPVGATVSLRRLAGRRDRGRARPGRLRRRGRAGPRGRPPRGCPLRGLQRRRGRR